MPVKVSQEVSRQNAVDFNTKTGSFSAYFDDTIVKLTLFSLKIESFQMKITHTHKS
jgi:hypothetical protein